MWNVGDQLDLQYWLSEQGIGLDAVTLVEQRSNGADLLDGTVNCAMAMSYNEYWPVQGAGKDRKGFIHASRYWLPGGMADTDWRPAFRILTR